MNQVIRRGWRTVADGCENKPDDQKQGDHVFTEKEERHVLLQHSKDVEEATKKRDKEEDDSIWKDKIPDGFEQPEESQELEDVVHQDLGVPDGDDPPNSAKRNGLVTGVVVTF